MRASRLALCIGWVAFIGGTLAPLGCEREVEVGPAAPAPSAAAVAPSVLPAPQRGPRPVPKKAQKIVILAGGDVSLARGCGQRILDDPTYNPLQAVAPLLRKADLTFVNLESQLTDQGGVTQSPHHPLVFCGPPGGAKTLARAGIDVVSLANNHIWDYGKSALFETMDYLDAAKVAYAGVGRQEGEAWKARLLEVKGWKVAWLAVTDIWNQGALDSHVARDYVAQADPWATGIAIRKARDQGADLVLVSYHGGSEYLDEPVQRARRFVQVVMNAGADAILGHHPHVPQGVAWFRGRRPVFYSLGNLVFAMHRDYPWTGTSFFARLTFGQDGDVRVEACPYFIMGHKPQLFDQDRARRPRELQLQRHLRTISATVGGTDVGEPGEHSCIPLTPRPRDQR